MKTNYPIFTEESLSEQDPDDLYEIQGKQQELKHEFIRAYLDIWVKNVGENSKRNLPPLNVCDLYAASGWATDKNKSRKWYGSALIAGKMFGEYPKGYKLFLNTYDKDEEKALKQTEILKEGIKNLEDCPHVYEKTTFTNLEITKATDLAIRTLNPAYPSVWLLDPYGPTQLPWKVVEKIGTNIGYFIHRKTGKEEAKKPEIIITFMTSILQRFSEERPTNIEIGYDMSVEEWRKKVEHYTNIWKAKNYENPKTYVVLDIYLEKLSKLYEKPPLVIFVPGDNDQIVYTMIHCTDNNQGHFLMKKKLSKEFEKYKVYFWTEKEGLQPIKSHYQKDIFSFNNTSSDLF